MAPVVAAVLAPHGRDAVRAAVGLAASVVVAMAFAAGTLAAVLDAALPGGGRTAARHEPVHIAGHTPALAPSHPHAALVALAHEYVGTPYVWGGADPRTGFDCSGLVQWAFRATGLAVPRTAQQQYEATAPVATEALRPGDLLFFRICCQPPDEITHVGIYVGAGQMVHAPAPGERVRVESVDTPYWRAAWAGAGRVPAAAAARVDAG